MHLSVVVPTYNEEKRIYNTLERIGKYLDKQNFEWEVVLIDDESSDRTVFEIEKFIQENKGYRLLKKEFHGGKGAAVKEGMLAASGDYILFCDANLFTPIEETDRLLYWLYQGYDIAIGSRNVFEPCVKSEVVLQSKIIGKSFNTFVKMFALSDFQDTQCGFKAFKREAAYDLFSRQKLMGFCFDVEILYLAVQQNMKIKEVAINCKYQQPKIKINKDTLLMLKDVLQVKKLHKDNETDFAPKLGEKVLVS